MQRLALVLALLLLVPTSALAGKYRDKARGFDLTLPDGWQKVDQGPVDALDRLVKQRQPNQKFKYTAAFSPASTDELVFPYMLVQFTTVDMRKASLDDMARALSAETLDKAKAQVQKSFKELGDLDFGKPYFDRERRRLIISLSMNAEDGTPLRGLCVGFPTKRGIVQLNFYAVAADFDEQVKVFQKVVESLRIDEGVAWEPASSDAERLGERVGNIVGIVLVLLCVGYFARNTGKHKPRRRRR